jgi:hypothetical protein
MDQRQNASNQARVFVCRAKGVMEASGGGATTCWENLGSREQRIVIQIGVVSHRMRRMSFMAVVKGVLNCRL